MFGLFSRKNEPLQLEGTVTILAPAETIFALVDFASPANRLAARGVRFSEKAQKTGRFAATNPDMPEIAFEFDVDLYEAPAVYGFASRIIAETPFGAFVRGREEYHIEQLDNNRCRVTLKTKNWWRDGLSGRTRRNEEAVMMQAVGNDLAKLKIEAEGLVARSAA